MVEEKRGCNKDVPVAVNHSNRCGGKTANQNSSDERRPVRKLSMLHCLGKEIMKRRRRGKREESQTAYLKQHRKLMSR